MPKYLFTGSYTAEGAKGILKEGGSSRREAIGSLVQSVGGTLESFYLGFGTDDFYLIADLPSNAAAAAMTLTVSATGTSRPRTIVLLTAEEVDEASKAAPTFRPPGG